jgi:chromatin segregation and condensation protein Rec8/ScpA/Scc1 (kleisin family)
MEEVKTYEVKLEIFEGPLDLLVYLVQKNELDPKDIPIAVITDQYLEYLENIGIKNLSHAGEFLVMASRLMLLKAHELLPEDEKDEMEDMELDLDKEALIQQMLEYQKFKEASKYLKHLELRNYGAFPRGKKERQLQEKQLKEMDIFEAGIYELLVAFSNAIKHKREISTHNIEIDDVTIENQMEKIIHMLISNQHFHFEEIFQDDARKIVIVVTFMAILELSKLNKIHAQQFHQYGPIWIYGERRSTERIWETKPLDMAFSEDVACRPGLVKIVQGEILKKKQENELERILGEVDFLKNVEVGSQGEELANYP